MDRLRELVQHEMARAEAIIRSTEGTNNKAYEPVVEHHKGQVLALKKVLFLLDNQSDRVYNRGDLLEWYVTAREDSWRCREAMPNGDYWEHAFLTKGKRKAEINIPGGILLVWRPDGTLIEKPIPYAS